MKILQLHCGLIDAERQKYVDSVDKYFPKEDIVRISYPARDDFIRWTDMERWRLMWQYAPVLMADTDIKFFAPLVPKWDLSRPAFAYADGHYDTFMIYMPDRSAIERFLENATRRKIQVVYGWQNKVLREYPHEIIPDEPGVWKHVRATGYAGGLASYALPLDKQEEYFNIFPGGLNADSSGQSIT